MNDFNPAAFSDAVADIAEQVASVTASFATHHGRTASAFHWRDGLFVAADETVEPDEQVELTLGSGQTVQADLAGRDPSTGIALFRLVEAPHLTLLQKANAVRPGSLVIASGRDSGNALAVLGTVGEVGPAWRSLRGGAIDRRINLAIAAGGRFEGGPVTDLTGALVGMLLFGPRGRALVIPFETIERTVSVLLEKGHVSRGYLGAGLHPVRDREVRGAMVMSLDEAGPAKAAGLALGDIVNAWDGEPVRGPRELIRRLGPDSAGAVVTLSVVRGGEARDVTITIGEKPLS